MMTDFHKDNAPIEATTQEPVIQATTTTSALPNDCTLRVRGGNPDDPDPKRRPTDPIGLSRSLLKVLYLSPERVVRLQCVGPVALFVACEAFQLAAAEFERRQHGWVLVNRQSRYTAEIGNRPAKGVCLRIFPIPIRDAL